MTEALSHLCSSVSRAVCSARALVKPYGIAIIGVALGTIVEAHCGSITPRSNPGGGTAFSFTLPAVTKEEVGDAV
jgi:signal transduction histidine kinase